jgi:hypothetical protein
MLNSIEAMVSTPTRQRKIIIRSELAGSKGALNNNLNNFLVRLPWCCR